MLLVPGGGTVKKTFEKWRTSMSSSEYGTMELCNVMRDLDCLDVPPTACDTAAPPPGWAASCSRSSLQGLLCWPCSTAGHASLGQVPRVQDAP